MTGPAADAACREAVGTFQLAPNLPAGSWGKARPNYNTCDGDKRFYGQVLDAVTDGSCVYAVFFESSTGSHTAGHSCQTGGWSSLGFKDPDGSGTSFLQVKRTSQGSYPGQLNGYFKYQSGF